MFKIQNPGVPMKSHYFFSQVHQPFFTLAFVNALFSMLFFMLGYKGILVLQPEAVSFHAYTLVYMFFTPAFLAFLFTTFPRFSSTPPIAKETTMKILGLFAAGSLLVMAGALFSSLVLAAGMLLLLAGQGWGVAVLRRIYMSSPMTDKYDQFWILTAMAFGLLSHMIVFGGIWLFPPLSYAGFETAIYLYLFLVGFSVAQRMVPFFSHCMTEKNRSLLKTVFGLLAAHVLLESVYPHASFPVDVLLAWVTAKELYRWKLPFPNPNPLLWILHISLFWVPVAFLFGAISNLTALLGNQNFLFLDIHILMLGFLFTILIGFGTRVTIGHSGNMMQADRWTTFLFNWTQLVVVVRILTSLAAAWGWNYLILFDISVTVWLLLFILWGIRFFPVLVYGKKL